MIQSTGDCVSCGQLGEDLDAGAGSDAVGAGVEHGGGVGERANAAGGFDAGAVPATPRRMVMSSTVAPPVEKPVLVLRKSAPAERASSEARSFSSKVRRQVSRMTLTMAPASWASSTTPRMSCLTAS